MDYEYDYEAPVSANADSDYELNESDLGDYFAKLAEEGL